jgi:GxxExxY protein
MPIEITESLHLLDQEAFGKIAYDVTEKAFQIHNKLGRFLGEDLYRLEMVHFLGSRAATEVKIVVRWEDFMKTYLVDLVVDGGALFELKAVAHLNDEHRAQLLNYLLLTGCRHGKLLNFRPERLEHEFVNTTLTHADRISFEVDDSAWDNSVESASMIRNLVEGILRDWGTGLDAQLYVDALTHFLGGEEQVIGKVPIVSEGRCIGHQRVRRANAESVLKCTTFADSLESFESHALRFLNLTNLKRMFWINISLKTVRLKTLTKHV